MYSKVMILGRLTKDPELRSTPSGTQVTEVSLAVNEAYKDSQGSKQERVSFIDVVFWGKGAETMCRWKKKGDLLFVEGRLQQDTWTDKESGKSRSKLKVVSMHFQFLSSKGGGDSKPADAAKSPREQFEEPQGYSSGGEEPPF